MSCAVEQRQSTPLILPDDSLLILSPRAIVSKKIQILVFLFAAFDKMFRNKGK